MESERTGTVLDNGQDRTKLSSMGIKFTFKHLWYSNICHIQGYHSLNKTK
jgi:hypothetical protein